MCKTIGLGYDSGWVIWSFTEVPTNKLSVVYPRNNGCLHSCRAVEVALAWEVVASTYFTLRGPHSFNLVRWKFRMMCCAVLMIAHDHNRPHLIVKFLFVALVIHVDLTWLCNNDKFVAHPLGPMLTNTMICVRDNAMTLNALATNGTTSHWLHCLYIETSILATKNDVSCLWRVCVLRASTYNWMCYSQRPIFFYKPFCDLDKPLSVPPTMWNMTIFRSIAESW